MTILFLALGDETVASTRARIYGYIPFLIKKGVKYKILTFTSKSKCRRILTLKRDNLLQYLSEIFYKIYIVTKLFVMSRKYEIVYVQKVILPKAIWGILQKLNKRVIFDFDDAIFIYKDINYLLKNAACVVTSNKFLKEHVMGYNNAVQELISPVNISKQLFHRRNNSVTLGWIGSPETSKYLYPLIPVLKSLKKRFQNLTIELMGVGDNKQFDSSDLNIVKWSLEAEKRHLERVDVGIMPLDDNEWSRSKGGYKLLLYMSMGVPCVATPLGVNKEIIKEGITGFFATSPQEWLDRIAIFLENSKLRKQIGEQSRLYVKEHFSYEAVLPKFLNMLNLCEKF